MGEDLDVVDTFLKQFEKTTWEELELIAEWLNEERIRGLSTSEKALFRFCRDVCFERPFAVVLKRHFPQLWNRLLGEARDYEAKSK